MSKNVLEYGLLSQFRVKQSNFQVFLRVPGKGLKRVARVYALLIYTTLLYSFTFNDIEV